jgi:PAS domain S-box-containing protein
LGADVKVLANPLVWRMVMGLAGAAFLFVMGIVLMRRVRRELTSEERSLHQSSPASAESFPLHTYHAVIQQLKQQKHELTTTQQAERRRAKATENISVAVLSNLSSGVLFFDKNGLVRQANYAARNILGFASPAGMTADEVFREAQVRSPSGQAATLAQIVRSTLNEGKPLRQMQTEYRTPSGEERALEVTVSPVPAADGSLLGAACLISDLTPIAQIRRQQELRGEMSAEMALALRTSLVTISGYAQQLAQNRDPEVARQLAADIAAESAHLDRTIGGFLAEAKVARAGSRTS